MRMYEIIEKKRDGYEFTYEEINFFIKGYSNGVIPDYQASALLMAIFFQGMSSRETADLTMAMANSGERIDLSEIIGTKVDKHSTGGVGDKTTLILAPIVAACGVPVAKMSGRGLGHTGGTIDKLESIPGFNTAISIENFIQNVKKIGISIAGQTGNLVPADKKIYALRDVTATINSIPLIASSIMSKKIASGADKIVLDVKTGSGAFMKTLDRSIQLARAMVGIGDIVGKKTVAIITDMDVPLGNAIGNSLEVMEAIDTLRGCGPDDLREVSFAIATKMLQLADIGDSAECRERVEDSIKEGSALKKLAEMIGMQEGNVEVINDYSVFEKAVFEKDIFSEEDGFIESIKTDSLGIAAMLLGAGRETKESSIDYSAGIVLNKKTGMKVKKGDLIARMFSNSEEKMNMAEEVFRKSLIVSKSSTEVKPLILAQVDSNGVQIK